LKEGYKIFKNSMPLTSSLVENTFGWLRNYSNKNPRVNNNES